jgi:hypothetical protein
MEILKDHSDSSISTSIAANLIDFNVMWKQIPNVDLYKGDARYFLRLSNFMTFSLDIFPLSSSEMFN